MSFYWYSNVNQLSSEGWTAADLVTDDRTIFLSDACIGATLYINDIAVGKIISRSIMGIGTYVLYKAVLTNGNFSTNPEDLGAAVNVTEENQYGGVCVITGLSYDLPIISVAIKDSFYQLSNTPTKVGDTLASKQATLWTDNPSVITAEKNSLVGQDIYINDIHCGTISGNELFNGNISGANTDIPWYSSSTLAQTASGKGKVLMQLNFTVTEAIGTNASLPQNIKTISFFSSTIIPSDWLYCTNNWVAGFQFGGGEYGALYHPGHLTSDLGSLTADNQFLWEPLTKGLLGLHLNNTFIAPIVDLRSGFGYVDETKLGQDLPLSHKTNPWPPTQRLGAYMTYMLSNVITPPTDITSISFKPYYRFKSTGLAWRIIVAGPPADVSYSTLAIPMISLVKSCTANRDLYIDGAKVGVVTDWGVENLVIDGRGPLNFAGFTGNLMSPPFKQYYFEVGEPLFVPEPTQNVFVSLDTPGLDSSLLRSGILNLVGVPPIAEGVNGLKDKRLIVNEIYIGIITANGTTSITTELGATTDLLHIPKDISGIWRLETTDNVGRVPLCVCTQMSICDYPKYPVLDINFEEYGQDYTYYTSTIVYYPDGLDMYTRRDVFTNLNNMTYRCLAHVFPKWVEHAHIDPETKTFRLAEMANEQLEQPIVAKYAYQFNLFSDKPEQFRKFWQTGSVVVIPYQAYLHQDYGSMWSEDARKYGFYACTNVPTMLQSPVKNEDASKVIEFYTLVPVFTTSEPSLPADTKITTPTGTVTTTPQGTLTPGTVICTEVVVTTSTEGSLPAGTEVVTTTGTIIVDSNGTLPAGTSVVTPNGTVKVTPGGTLPADITISTIGTITVGAEGTIAPGVVVVTPNGTVTTQVGSRLPPGITVTTPTGTAIVDAAGKLPAGTTIVTDAGNVTVLPDGTLPTDTKVKIVTNGSLTPQLFDRQSLCSTSIIEYACAPHSVELIQLLLEGAAVLETFIEVTIIEKAGYNYAGEISTLSTVALNMNISSAINSITAPKISISTSVKAATDPGVPGAVIRLKRGSRANLPPVARTGEALVTLDTAELFIGTGTGVRKVSDIIVSDTEPTAADTNKLWYNPITNITSIYTQGAWSATVSDAARDYGVF